MSLVPGVRIGGYEILATLGAGGMGEVYRARDTKIKRDVALKILPESFANDPDRLARFQREAEVLGALNHPLIAHIYGIEEGLASGEATAVFSRAIIMELVEGEDLAQRIARGAIPIDEALPIARQIAEALEAAHEQGIIHRDLKPANIKLRPDGTIKVLDFGLAKALDAAAEPAKTAASPLVLNSPTITTPAMTLQGMILGTAAYMAPEQAKGYAADKRSDVWAFGCVLFELLTGRRPFDGQDVPDTLALVLKGEPDWVALPAAVPPAVTTLLRRCLERDRQRRIASIATAIFVIDEAASLVKSVAQEHDASNVQSRIAAAVAEARSRLLRRRVLPAAVFLTVAIALAGAAAWRTRASPPAPAPITRFVLTLPVVERLPSIARNIVAISSDGAQVAYIGGGRLFVRRLEELNAREIDIGTLGQTSATIHSLAFSPDNRSLAFYAGTGIYRIALAGGAPVSVCTVGALFGLSWDDTGIIVALGPQGIVRCPAAGGAPETLATVGPGEEANGPQLLPGGRNLLFTIAKVALGERRWDQAQLVVQPIGGGARKVVLQNGAEGRYLSTGHLLHALDGLVLAAPFDLERLEVTGEPEPVIEGVRRTLTWVTGAAQFALSETGTLVYVPGPARTSGERLLAIADRDGVVTRLDVPAGMYDHVRASPDGRRLAIGTDDGRQAIVWILDLTSKGALQRLTQDGRNALPIWSPDGQRLAFQSDREGDLAIYSQRVDGTGTERLTKAGPGEIHAPESWSPDGAHLLFSIARDSRVTLHTLSLQTRSVSPFGTTESGEPPSAAFSPNGKWVVYTVGDSGGAQSSDRGVFVQPFPATGVVYQLPRIGLDFHPVWASGGAEIVWVPSAISMRHALATMSTRSGVTFGMPRTFPARVTALRVSGQRRGYDILPDGRFVGTIGANEPESEALDRFDTEIRVVLNWHEELKRLVPTRK